MTEQLTMDELIKISSNFDVKKKDFYLTFNEINFNSSHHISLDFTNFSIEKHAFFQMYHKLMDEWNGELKRPVIFSNTIIEHYWKNPTLSTFALNFYLDNLRLALNDKRLEKKLLFRFDENLNTVRAVLSDEYGFVFNTDLLIKFNEILKKIYNEFRVVNALITRDHCNVKVCVREFDSSRLNNKYGVGYAIYNDEIGRHSVLLYTLLKRNNCDNSFVLDNVKRLYHRGNVSERLDLNLNNLEEAMLQTQKYIDLIDNLLDIQINFDDSVEKLQKKYQLTDLEVEHIYNGAEGQLTNVWGFLQGITCMAKYLPESKQMLIERFAGDLIQVYL